MKTSDKKSISINRKLDEALRFLSTHGNKGGSFEYYDKVKSESNKQKDYLFKHLNEKYGLSENEMYPILYNLIGDKYIDAVWEPLDEEKKGNPPNQIKISYKGIAFIHGLGYRKARCLSNLKILFRIANITILTLAAIFAILYYSIEISKKNVADKGSTYCCPRTM